MAEDDESASSTGLAPNLAGLLCYLAGWISGLVFLLIEKDDDFVRFHAMQSIVVFGALTAAYIVVMIASLVLNPLVVLIPVLWIAGVILWILLMVKAYKEEEFKIPWAGEFAEDHI